MATARTKAPEEMKGGDEELESESWRLSDAHGTPMEDDIKSVTEHGGSDRNPGSSQQDAEPVPIVEIRYSKVLEDEARAYKRREERRDQWKVFLAALMVVGLLAYGVIAYRKWHTMLVAGDNSTKALKDAERAYADTFQATERAYATALQVAQQAYVIFGSKNGELGEFIDNPVPGHRRIIALHFYNSGYSTARHLAVHVITGSGDSMSSRHRFKGMRGNIVTTGVSVERDLPAGAEHLEYIISPWSQRELSDNMTGRFSISGQFEYCDVFGSYHCRGFRIQRTLFTQYQTVHSKFFPIMRIGTH